MTHETNKLASDLKRLMAMRLPSDDRTRPSPAAGEELVERAVEAALHAPVPGGSEVWVWLPQKDAWTPSDTARDVMRCAIRAALAALRGVEGQQPDPVGQIVNYEELAIQHGQQVTVTFKDPADAFKLFNEIKARTFLHVPTNGKPES